jgi:hypothetical protein
MRNQSASRLFPSLLGVDQVRTNREGVNLQRMKRKLKDKLGAGIGETGGEGP